MLSLHITVKKVIYVKFNIALITPNKTMLQQLEKYNLKLVKMFGLYQVKNNKIWVKYIIQDILQQIKTLNDLTNISIAITKEAFEIVTKMKPK